MGNDAHFESYDGKGWGGPSASSRCHLGRVESIDDAKGRVQVRLFGFSDEESSRVWARVLVPFAGDNYGAYFLPHKGEEVLIQFINADTRQAVVVGSLWNGNTGVPEKSSDDQVDHYALVGRAGSKILIKEEGGVSGATIEMTTPGGARATLTEESGGKVELEYGDARVTLERGKVSVSTAGEVSISASSATIKAPKVDVQAGTTTFTGLVKCDILQTNMVISTVYTPGAGNIL